MNKFYVALLTLLPAAAIAQPAGYYDAAAGTSGQSLRAALSNIIRPHTALTYGGLWTAYSTTDVKPNGKLWDIYSDVPGGTPAYEYTMGSGQCGSSTVNVENNCYNREHTWPRSKFGGTTMPMYTDLFLVYPTDHYVNGLRSNYPYGKVGTASHTFTNGSKFGNNSYPGAPSTDCYEPLDSFKGDIARNYFYISTCYRNDSALFSNWEMATQVTLNSWSAQMLLEWHHNDPVSKKEIDRNNAVYAIQGNRNPFIDHPEWADCIWGSINCAPNGVETVASGDHFTLFPNPANNEVVLDWNTSAVGQSTIKVCNVSGQVVYTYTNQTQQAHKLTLSIHDWAKGMYFVQLVNGTQSSTQKLIVE